MLNPKRYFPNLKFNIASSIYLAGAIIVTMKFQILFQNRLFLILSLLLSITFLICAYQNKKTHVDKIIENSIVKWVSTVLIFSVCLWYSKHKLNWDYDIETGYLNYSAYGYAFALAISLCLFIYGLCIFTHIYLRRITAYQAFYAAIITLPLCYMLKDYIEHQKGVNFILTMLLVIGIPYGFIIFFKQFNCRNKINKNMFIFFKVKTITINRARLILKIWFKKHLIVLNNYLKVSDLMAIAAALIFVGLFSISIIPDHQRSFLLLDAFSTTDCNTKKDSYLYLRKSSGECYRITSKGIEIMEMKSFPSST
ncbi:hypothetical protein IFU02_009560 [Pantoea agglomerans]|uniref:hypothetical protein n=1 Tax=Enterobacter agglomerans TaxID=549 RepID=UPI001787735D|nr:hypothetical protein [Pantoea agglomerans]WVL86650.1 hypothetical protein IFU02_009560 [Pantoea agglomerans]